MTGGAQKRDQMTRNEVDINLKELAGDALKRARLLDRLSTPIWRRRSHPPYALGPGPGAAWPSRRAERALAGSLQGELRRVPATAGGRKHLA
jgi:hypothetical protein